MWTKLIIAGVAVFTIGLIIYLGYQHYTGLLKDINTLTSNNAKLDGSVKAQKDTITAQVKAVKEWKDAQDALVKRVDEAQRIAEDAAKDTRRLNGLFKRHNLTELARRKPKLIERRINRGTDDAIRMLECASGARHLHCPDGRGAPAGTPASP